MGEQTNGKNESVAEGGRLGSGTSRNASGAEQNAELGGSTVSKDFMTQLATRLEEADRKSEMPPRTTISSQTLERQLELGRGGLGIVYEYRDCDLNRAVAFKVAQPKCLDNPRSLRQFVHEYEVTASLDHPSIPSVYAAGQLEDGRPYYVMRLVRGAEFGKLIEEWHAGKDVNYERDNARFQFLLEAFLGVCEAIQHAHERGALHCDIKPHNIMVEKDGSAFIVDWGFSLPLKSVEKHIANENSHSERQILDRRMGSPAWMSPEQASPGMAAHEKTTDIYGLGATLFNLLTGKPPHTEAARRRLSSESDDSWVDLICDYAMPLRALEEGRVPPELASICARCMATRQGDRYQSALSIATDIRRWIRREPVLAHEGKYSVLEVSGTWIANHSRLSAALLFSFAAALIASAAIAWYSSEMNRVAVAAARREKAASVALFDAFENITNATLDEKLLKHPELRELRNTLLQLAENGYDNWPRAGSAAASDISRAAQGQATVARIHLETGRTNSAVRIAKKSVALWNRLEIAGDSHRVAHAEGRRVLAMVLLASGKFGEAEAELLKATNLLNACERTNEVTAATADVLHQCARVCYFEAEHSGDPVRRKQILEKGLGFSEKSMMLQDSSASETTPARKLRRAMSLNISGLFNHKLGNTQEAIRCYELATAFVRSTLDLPGLGRSDGDLARRTAIMINCNLGMSLTAEERHRAAIDLYQRTIEECHRMVAEFPFQNNLQVDLARSYGNLADAYRNEGDHASEEAARLQAIERYWALAQDFPDVPEHSRDAAAHTISRCFLLHKMGQDEKCAREFRSLTAKFPRPEDVEQGYAGKQLQVAMCFLIADEMVETESFRARAVRVLERIQARGWLEIPEIRDEVMSDPVMAEFREWLYPNASAILH